MDLEEKMKLFLDSELAAYKQNGRTRGGLGTFNINLQSVPNNGWTNVGSVTQYLFPEPNKDFINSENAKYILTAYSLRPSEDKAKIEKYLLNCLDKDGPYRDISYLVIFIFIRIGKLEEAINTAVNSLKGDDSNAYSNALHLLKLVISREYSYFSYNVLTNIGKILENDQEAGFALLPTLREARKKIVSLELSNQENPEVIDDMKGLITFFNANFPDGDISDQIKHVQDLFEQGIFNEITYATCVGRVRILLVSTVKYLAKEKGIKSVPKDDKLYAKWLFDNKHITNEDHEIIKSFYSLCSNEGSHISQTSRENARLIKNIAYEIILLLLNHTKTK